MIIQILAGLAFVLLGSGIVVAVRWFVGTSRPAGPASPVGLWMRTFWRGGGRTAVQRRTRQTMLLAALAAGALTWVFTGWPVGGVIVAVAIPGIPWLFSSSNAEKKAVARLGAMEAWTRRLGDYVRNGIGLQAAIVATARTAPLLLSSEIRTLAARLQAGVDPTVALRSFADELDDDSCDEVIAPLILQLSDAGDGLFHALNDIAHGLSEEITSRSTVDSERATARYTVRFLTGATILLIGLGAFNPDYAAPYRSLVGQLMLVVLAVLYIALMLWIRSLSMPERRPRLLRRLEIETIDLGRPAETAGAVRR